MFPAIDIPKSGTRREDLLLTTDEQEAVYIMRRALNGNESPMKRWDTILNLFQTGQKQKLRTCTNSQKNEVYLKNYCKIKTK